jgi:hypothetical protein
MHQNGKGKESASWYRFPIQAGTQTVTPLYLDELFQRMNRHLLTSATNTSYEVNAG